MNKLILGSLLLSLTPAWGSIPDSPINPDTSHIIVSQDSSSIQLDPNGFDSHHPSQDTINLQWIFKHYPHADINLVAGTYHISETIEAPGYQGEIRGAGKNVTYIVGRGYPDINNQYVFPALSQELTMSFYPSTAPSLIWFHATAGYLNNWNANAVKLSIKDLTFRMDGLGPQVALYQIPFRSIWTMIAITGHDAVMSNPSTNIDHADINISNVAFKGQTTAYELDDQTLTNSNAAAGIVVYGGALWSPQEFGLNGWDEADHMPINASLSITDSEFDNLHQNAISAEGFFTRNTQSNYQFPTNPTFPKSFIEIKDNLLNHVGGGTSKGVPTGSGILILSPSEASVEIKDNRIDNNKGSAIKLIRGSRISIPEKIAIVTISDNLINSIPSVMNKSALVNFDGSKQNDMSLQVTVKENLFTGKRGYDKPMIENMSGFEMIVKNNIFQGHGDSAINTGTSTNPSDPSQILQTFNDNIKDNNFADFIATSKNIVLGTGSQNAFVKTSSLSDVSNLGTGNTIVASLFVKKR